MSLAREMRSRVPAGAIRLWWLGQAGFAFKTHSGAVILVDPYLSDAAERLHGFKRLSLPPIAAEQVRADWVIVTHEHTDHLDPDSLPVFARNNPACRFAAPAGCRRGLADAGIAADRYLLLDPNQEYDLGSLKLHTAPADHGDLSASALSLVLRFEEACVLHSGDTALRPSLMKPLYDLHPDVLLPCINGTFGNMNHLDAATMAAQAGPRVVIPHHFWLFAEHGGDPGAFVHACRAICPTVTPLLLKPGEGMTWRRPRPNSRGQSMSRCSTNQP